jgi:hypothetical protein
MRKALVLIAALAALFAGATVAVAKTKHVATTTTIAFAGTQGPYGEFTNGTFSGQIFARAKCNRDRTVVVRKVVGGGVVGTTQSGHSGAWSVTSAVPVTPGQYMATVQKRVIKKKIKHGPRKGKRKRTVCEQAFQTGTAP